MNFVAFFLPVRLAWNSVNEPTESLRLFYATVSLGCVNRSFGVCCHIHLFNMVDQVLYNPQTGGRLFHLFVDNVSRD